MAHVSGDAVVAEYAVVTGNAVVSGGQVRGDWRGGTSRGSQVYDRATVSAGSVTDGARVYGDADVSGGVIRGNARVYGDADVSGGVIGDGAHVRGRALIGEGMVLDEGIYDGRQEYVRAAKQTYDELFIFVVSTLDDCDVTDSYSRDRKEALAREVLAGIFRIDFEGCAWLAQMREFAIRITPNSVDLVLTYAFPVLKSLDMGLYAKSLVTIAAGVKDMRDIRRAGLATRAVLQAMESMNEEFEKLRQLEDIIR